MKRAIFWCGLALAICVFAPTASAQYRVDINTPANVAAQNGLTWATAFATIQQGINAAYETGSGGQVWVANGTYEEARAETWGGETGSLILKDGVELYGGFAGYDVDPWEANETSLSMRSVNSQVTVISGRVADGGNRAYHTVVVGTETDETTGARIDGFHITQGGVAAGGESTGDYYHTWRGGGLYNYGSDPVIANCTFYDNYAPVSGGAISNEYNPNDVDGGRAANPTIINCVFYNNIAGRAADPLPNGVRGGGAIFSNQSSATIIHCTFYNNTHDNDTTYTVPPSGINSGAVYAWACSPVITHSILWLNEGGAGVINAGPRNVGDTLWDAGTSISYSVVQAGYACPARVNNPTDPAPALGFWTCGSGNTTADPAFAATGPTFPIGAGSALNAGSSSAVGGVTTDLQGIARPQGANVDLGAYEGNISIIAPTADINDTALGSLLRYVSYTFNLANLGSTGTFPVRYWWDINSDNTRDYSTAAPSHTYTAAGDYTVTLWVSNAVGSDSDTMNVSLRNPVTVGAPTPLNPANINNYTSITFSVAGTVAGGYLDPVPNDDYNYQWQWSSNNSTWTTTLPDGNTLTDGNKTATRPGRNAAIDPVDDPVNAYLVDVDYTIAGANSPTLTIDHALANVHNGYYRCVVWDDKFTTLSFPQGAANSVSTQLNITDKIVILEQPVPGEYYDGNDLLLDVTCIGSTAPQNYSYQWTLNNVSIQNTNLNPYEPVADSSAPVMVSGSYVFGTGSRGNYRVTISSAAISDAKVSNPAFIEVKDPVTIATGPTDQLWNVTESAIFTVVATGGYLTGDYDYQWFYNGTPLVDGGAHPSGSGATISGATTDSLTIDNLFVVDAGTYSVAVRDDKYPCTGDPLDGLCEATDSAVLQVSNDVRVSDDPDSLNVYELDDVTFTVVGAAGTPPYTYQWYWVFDDDLGPVTLSSDGPHPSGSGAVLSGVNSATLSISDVQLGVDPSGNDSDAGEYFCVVDDSVTINDPATSDSAVLAIYKPVNVTSNPGSLNRYAGQSAQFSITATGGMLNARTYRWQADTGSGFVNLSDGGSVSGATSATLTVDPLVVGDNNTRYRCVVTSATSDVTTDPANTTDASSDALLLVSTELVLLDQPADVQAYVTDSPFTLRTHFEGGMPSYTADWLRTGVDPVSPEISVGPGTFVFGTPNTTMITVNPGAVAPGEYDYAVEITDQVTTKRSGSGRVEVANYMSFVQPLGNRQVREHDELDWTVVVSGGLGDLRYKWFKQNGAIFEEVPEDADHIGTLTATLKFREVALEDEGRYRVEVSDDYNTIFSQGQLAVGNALPAVSLAGLAALAAASALGGASALRRRQRK